MFLARGRRVGLLEQPDLKEAVAFAVSVSPTGPTVEQLRQST
jgi:hypothetical protein